MYDINGSDAGPAETPKLAVDAMAQSCWGGVEHSVHIPAHRGAGQGEVALAVAASPPEKWLNRFVRCVALIERLGNALGTLAFTWATVVLLGGYVSDLIRTDFGFGTAIFFLEGIRMFSRNNRMDYQRFFGTKGAFRPLGWNGLILIVYFNGMLCIIARKSVSTVAIVFLPLLGILVAIGQFVCSGVPRLLAHNPLRRVISLWSPMVAIVLLGPSVPAAIQYGHNEYFYGDIPVVKRSVGRWVTYVLLLVVVLLMTISKMKFSSIMKLMDSTLGRKQEFWRRVILSLCMIGAVGIVLYSFGSYHYQILMILAEVITLVFVSFGNLQIPAAIVRVVLPLLRIGSISKDYATPSPAPALAPPPSADISNHEGNLIPSLNIFYWMVLGQGVLYITACVIEIFSFIPRRSLVHHGGFKGQMGVDSVNLFYAYALEKCMERNVFDPMISLCNFAIDSLNSDSTKRQLHGIQVIHILLQRDPTRTQLLVKLNASPGTMTRLMRMMNWTGQGRETIRLFAVKVIDELARDLLVVTIPGIVQNASLLLDCGDQQKRGRDPILDADDEQEQINGLCTGDEIDRGDAVIQGTRNLLEIECRFAKQVRDNKHHSWITRWWRQVSAFWSIPQEGPLTEHDLLPVFGMSIIGSLATYDQSNCEEINKATILIRKITRFTRFRISDTNYTDAEKKVLVHSSLKLFHRLTSINGEIGITLRHKISKHPFLLRNLSEVLGDITSSHEPKKLAAGILRNLAVDVSVRHMIGGAQRIITRLMDAFLTPDGPSSTDGDRLLRKVAGQALAMLAMGNANNCLAMLREETGYSFIKQLTTMIHLGRYRCVAASLLRSLCMHNGSEFKETDLKELSYISREVLERIQCAEGAELEIFVGLGSHIYKAIPEEFAREFEYSQVKETFVKRLVDALNANMEPNGDCPGIRRVILEQAVNLMEYDPRNVNCFRDYRMMEAVSIVEETMSEAENYSLFLGDVGLMEAGEPLSSLVAKAKQLLRPSAERT